MELVHHTDSADAVSGILSNGFAYVANQRDLIANLVGFDSWEGKEPQQFGMVSFHERLNTPSARHLGQFGQYAICVSREWAVRHGASPVLYVGSSGPLFDSLQSLFVAGYDQVKRQIASYGGDAMHQMAYHNRYQARVIGADLYDAVLGLYEFLEPLRNSYQNEWRITHPYPHYGISENAARAVEEVSPPEGWAQVLNVIRISPPDVRYLVSPNGASEALRDKVPDQYRDIPIYEISVEQDA